MWTENSAQKQNKITASNLQNPSDPDATYRSKAGKNHKGYVCNLVETVGENGDSLITMTGYEQNIHSDSAFFKEYLERRAEDAEPEIMITDGAYDGNLQMQTSKEKLRSSCFGHHGRKSSIHGKIIHRQIYTIDEKAERSRRNSIRTAQTFSYR